jgi:hypothetical protein
MKNRIIAYSFIFISYQSYSQNNKFKSVVDMLYIIDNDDQKFRNELDELEKKFGLQSKEVKEKWNQINKADSVNLTKVKGIIEKYGWLSVEEIGNQGNSTLFMVIQHADIKTQECFLPIMRDAVKNKKAKPNELALLEDRIALRQNKKQIYGSQIGQDEITLEYYVMPLLDPDNVDKRRKEVGLRPIADYLLHWDMKWDIEKYKKELPLIEEKLKIYYK